MASQIHPLYPRRKRWRARVKIDWVEYFLGYFDTQQQAEEVEEEFRERNHLPPKRRKSA